MKTRFLPIAVLWVQMICAPGAEWPGREWTEVAPAKMGLDEALLIKARDYAASAGGSGLIVFRGMVVVRWGDQERLYDIKSATKSIGATALGIAVDDGKIELDAAAAKYHPGFGVPPESNRESGWLPKITVRQLATQSGGFEKPGGFGRLLAEPGTRWIYSDGGPNWLAECITLIYREDIEDMMFERVFTPIGIRREELRWRKHSYRTQSIEGIACREFGAGVHANVGAMARIGYMHLRRGEWDGKKILSPEFIAEATRPQKSIAGLQENDAEHGNASEHYGLLWWNNGDGTLKDVPRDGYWAWGLYDSLIVVIPSLDIVAVRGGQSGKSWPRKKGADHYDVLRPFLEPIVASTGKDGVNP